MHGNFGHLGCTLYCVLSIALGLKHVKCIVRCNLCRILQDAWRTGALIVARKVEQLEDMRHVRLQHRESVCV